MGAWTLHHTLKTHFPSFLRKDISFLACSQLEEAKNRMLIQSQTGKQMYLDILQLKLDSQRLSCLQHHWGEQLPWGDKAVTLSKPEMSSQVAGTNNSTSLSFVLDCGREYYNAFIAIYCQQVPKADACMGQLVGKCCAALPSADLAGTGHSCPDQHSAFGLRTQELLPKTWHRSLKKKNADVQFLKLFQAPMWVVFSFAPSAKTTGAGGV